MDFPPSRSSINFSRPLRGQLEPPSSPPLQFAFPIAPNSRSSRRTRQEVLNPSYAVRSRPHVVATPSLPPSPNTTSFPSSSSSLSRDLRRLHRRQTSLLSKTSPLSPAELLSLQVTQQHIIETQSQLRDRPIPSLPFPLGGVWNGEGEEGSDEFGIMLRSGGGGVKEGTTSRLGSIVVDSLTTRRSTSARRSPTGRVVQGSPVRAIHHGKEGAKPTPYGRRKDKTTSEGSTSPTTKKKTRRPAPLVSKLSNLLQPRPSSSSKNNKRPSSPSSQASSPPPPPKRAKRKFSLASLRSNHSCHLSQPNAWEEEGSCSAGVPAGWRRKRTRSNWAAGEEDFELVTGVAG